MKIKSSFKLFFIMVMLLLGLAMALSFSALTLNYFYQGLDRGLKQSLLEAAEVEGVQDGLPVSIIGYHVASDWQDLPEQIKTVFANSASIDSYRLEKRHSSANYFSRPEEIYFVLKVKNRAGQLRYVAKIIRKENAIAKKHHVIPHIAWIAIFAIVSIGFFLLVVFFIIAKVTKPIQSLKDWAKSLDEDKLQQAIPDFHYNELNTLAKIIRSSLNSVQDSLARELQFLSYASHELRTPITVIRSNSELLAKLQAIEGASQKQSAVLARIERAGKTMTNLTETLLWLSRDDSHLPASEAINLAEFIEDLVAELDYLLVNKSVQLDVQTMPFTIIAAAIPCRIILSNLIRNAFQHTHNGTITIVQNNNSVSIVNASDDKIADAADLGFGLGLRLTKKLANRYGWQYCEKIEESIYQVQICF